MVQCSITWSRISNCAEESVVDKVRVLSVGKLLSQQLGIRGTDPQVQLAEPLVELRGGYVVDNFAELWGMCGIMEGVLDLHASPYASGCA